MEVRSAQGIITSREPFTISMQKDPVHSQPSPQSMRLAYAPDGTAIYKPISAPSPPSLFQAITGEAATPASSAGATGPSSGGNGTMGGDVIKKKRGRPRKYGPDGSTMSLGLVQSGSDPVGSQDGLNSPSSGGAGKPISSSANPNGKKRGRPPGSTNKKHHTAPLGSEGIGFTPHVITVKAGEDVSSKIMSFSQNSPRAVCVLSANGAISNVTLRQASTSGGTVTYEGRFEILSLSGSYMLSESGAQRSRTGGLSISLAGPDGRVLGGGVAGLLTAASPVQVIIGSFIAEGKKEKKEKKEKKHQAGPLDPTNKIAPGGGAMGPTSPPTRGTVGESSGGPSSPFNFNQSNNSNINSGQPSFSGIHWK